MDQGDKLRVQLADRYAIVEEVGRGGMAVVYRAKDLRHQRDVAIKALRPEFALAVGSDRFLREIQIDASLQHPNILPLHDSGEVDGTLYYVMPFVDGETLRDRIDREEQLPLDDALGIVREVASALDYAHSRGVVHRDIKPENILLSSGHAVVSDFGIARAIASAGGEELTDSGLTVGTPAYMSPEQASGKGRIDGRSDVYSLGCVLFEMLTGEPPFTGRSAQAIIARHMQERIPSIEVLRPTTPAGVTLTLERALAKVPADRFHTAGEMVQALQEEPPRKWFAVSPSVRRLTALVALVVLAISTAVLAAIVLRPPAVRLDRNKIVVFPLEERNLDSSWSGAGYDAAVVIGTALEQADPLKPIDIRQRLTEELRVNPAEIGVSQAREMSRDRGAGFFILGAVYRQGDSTSVTLRLYDVAGDSLVDQQSASGALTDTPLHHVVIDATKDLLGAIIDPGRVVDLDLIRDRRTAAIALWIQGEKEYRRSRFLSALDLYERALADDSGLVFAAFKGAQAASWKNRPDEALQLVSIAVDNDSLLPVRHRFLALGLQAYWRGTADSAVAWLEQAVDEDPEWAEAHMALGEVFYHLLPSTGPLDVLAEDQFELAWSLDSGFSPPALHLAEIAIRKGDIGTADSLVALLMQVNPDQTLMRHLTLMLDCVRDGGRTGWAEAAAEDLVAVFHAAKLLSAGGHQVGCSEAAFRAVIDVTTADPGYRWAALLGLQGLLVATGRDAEARSLLDSAVAAGRSDAMALYVLNSLAGSPIMGSKANELEPLTAQWFGENFEEVLGPQSLWVLAAWNAANGRVERVAAFNRALQRRAEAGGDDRMHMYSDALAAHVVLLRGDTSRAIDAFKVLSARGTRQALAFSLGQSLPVERLELARLLYETGDYRGALDVATVFDHPEPMIFLPFLPASLVVRMKAATALEEKELADRYRGRLTELGRSDLH